MPNLSDYKSQTRYNPRLAAQNAVNQDTAHAQALLANSSAAVRADQARYNDPNYTPVVNTGPNGTSQTEKAFGSITNDPNVLAALKQQASTPSSALLNEANTVYNRQPGQTTVYNPGQNGTIGIAQNIDQGQIALNAYNRLLSSGMDPATAAAKLNSEGYSMGVRSAFTAAQPGVIDISGLKPQTIAGVEETPAMFEQRKAAIAQQNAALEAQNTQKQIQEQNKNAAIGASDAAGNAQNTVKAPGTQMQTPSVPGGTQTPGTTPQVPTATPQNSAIESILATLTPENRALLEPMIRQQMAAINQSNAMSGMTYGSDMKTAQNNFDDVNSSLQKTKTAYDDMYKGFGEMLTKSRDDQLAQIAEQQKVNKERLEWEQTKQTRDLKDAERKAIDQKIGEMAIMGGFGSYAAGQVVDETRNKFESAISDLSIEYSLQKSESAVKFTGLHNQVLDQYKTDTINTLSSYAAKLEQINSQMSSNKVAKNNAEKSAWDTFVKTHTENANKASENIASLTKTIYDSIADEKKQKSLFEQQYKLWDHQSEMADKRAVEAEQRAQNAQEAALAKEQRAAERASADDVRSQYDKVMGMQEVEDYLTLRDNQKKMSSMLNIAIGSNDPNVVGAVKQLAMTMTAKISDPTTGVRESELQKFGQNQTWIQKVKQADKAIRGGDMTGISLEAVNAYNEMLILMSNEQRNMALTNISPVVNAVITHNNRAEFLPLNPADVFAGAPEFLSAAKDAFSSYTRAESRLGQGYNFGDWNTTSASGGVVDAMAMSHQSHEGFGTKGAVTITKNNNPGALRWNPAQAQFGGINDGSGFTKFPTYEQGLAALKADVRAKLTGKSAHINYANNPTLLDYAKVYSPASDGNNPNSYAMVLVRDLNKAGYHVTLDTPLSKIASLLNNAQL